MAGIDSKAQVADRLCTGESVYSKRTPLAGDLNEVVPVLAVFTRFPKIILGRIPENERVIATDLQNCANFLRRIEMDLPPPVARLCRAFPSALRFKRKTVAIDGTCRGKLMGRAGGRNSGCSHRHQGRLRDSDCVQQQERAKQT